MPTLTSPTVTIDTPQIQGSSAQRFDTVDMMRGLATLAVILTHSFIHTRAAGFKLNAGMPPWLEQLVLRNGDNGVHIFFAISGFLITFTSVKRFGSLGAMQPLRFYRIRFARIAPMLLLLLAVLTAMHKAHIAGYVIDANRESLRGALLSALTFNLNWYEALHGYLPANWGVLWSLSVEEMFYLFFPLLCFALARNRRSLAPFVALLCLFMALGPFARTVWSMNRIWRDQSYLGAMDAIAMGCLTALLAVRFQRRPVSDRTLLSLQVAGALVLLWMMIQPQTFLVTSGLDRTIVPLATCLITFASVLRNRRGAAWTTPLRWFGTHSYEVYLTHEFVVLGGVALLVRIHHGPVQLWAAGFVLATAPVGWLLAKSFSEPINRTLRGNPHNSPRIQSA